MSYHDNLPREFTVPVICRIKRKFYDYKKQQMMYELEPIVLPERDDDQAKETSPPAVHAGVAKRGA